MYSIVDSTGTLTGDLIQIPYIVQSYTSAEFDPGSVRKLVPGARESPLYVSIGSATPKLTLEFSSAKEYWQAWQACGGALPTTTTISFVFFNLLVGLDDWEFLGGILPAPGFKADDGGTKFKIDYLPTSVLLNGSPIYQS